MGLLRVAPRASNCEKFVSNSALILSILPLTVTANTPTDLVDVELDPTNGRHHIKTVLPKPEHTWCDVTTPSKMERALLAQNKQHLQQTTIEGGTSDSQPMKLFREEMGLGSAANALLQGTFQTKYEVGVRLLVTLSTI